MLIFSPAVLHLTEKGIYCNHTSGGPESNSLYPTVMLLLDEYNHGSAKPLILCDCPFN